MKQQQHQQGHKQKQVVATLLEQGYVQLSPAPRTVVLEIFARREQQLQAEGLARNIGDTTVLDIFV